VTSREPPTTAYSAHPQTATQIKLRTNDRGGGRIGDGVKRPLSISSLFYLSRKRKKKPAALASFFFFSAFLPQSACRKGILDPGKASSRLCERSPSRKSFRPIFIHVILPKLLVFVIHVLMGIASLSLGREAAKSKGAAGE